jgi:hypothetical protein
MQPTIYNLTNVIIIIFIVRYVVLNFFPKLIINGYISIFVCFFFLTKLFTNNPFFSIMIGLVVINSRILYRRITDQKTLSNYNSVSNCLIFSIALIILGYVLIHFEIINTTINQYYGWVIALLIIINLYLLEPNLNNNQLLCFA